MTFELLSIVLYIEEKHIDERRYKMLTLHPNILEKDGKKEFAILPYTEFLKIQEELEDFEDLRILREAKAEEANCSTISLSSLNL
jgi:hypothetical protein